CPLSSASSLNVPNSGITATTLTRAEILWRMATPPRVLLHSLERLRLALTKLSDIYLNLKAVALPFSPKSGNDASHLGNALNTKSCARIVILRLRESATWTGFNRA